MPTPEERQRQSNIDGVKEFRNLNRRRVYRLRDPERFAYPFGWVVGVIDSLRPFDKIKPLSLKGKSPRYKAMFQSGHRVGFGDH
ncbi:MAG: hypothetical protein AAB573_05310 [Patescibacteria group bacterium]